MSREPQYVDLQVNGYAGVDFNQDDLSEADLHLGLRAAPRGRRGRRLGDDRHRRVAADGGPAGADRRHPAAGSTGARGDLGHPHRGPVHQRNARLRRGPSAAGRSPGRRRRHEAVAGRRRRADAPGDAGPRARSGHEGGPVSGRRERSWWRPATAIRASTSLRAAIDAGLSMFTHLGNGCPMLLHRHDNIIQRVLSLRERLTICFIADGVHIPPMALGNYLRLVGIERAIVVTDAISAARLGPGRYTVGSRHGRDRRGPGRPLARWLALHGLDGDHAADGRPAARQAGIVAKAKSSNSSSTIRAPCLERAAVLPSTLRPPALSTSRSRGAGVRQVAAKPVSSAARRPRRAQGRRAERPLTATAQATATRTIAACVSTRSRAPSETPEARRRSPTAAPIARRRASRASAASRRG